MRKIVIIAICIFVTISCYKQDNVINPTATTNNKLSEISTSKIIDNNLSIYLKTAFINAEYIDKQLTDNLIDKTLSINSFNFDALTNAKLSGVEGEAILISNKYSPNYTLVVYKFGDEIKTPMLIEVQKDNMVKYFDLNSGNSFGIIKDTNSFRFLNNSITSLGSTNSSKNLRSTADCGQGTIDCIQDAYMSHGWLSVWAFVQTAYLPPTAAAIAVACASKNCGGANQMRPTGEHR